MRAFLLGLALAAGTAIPSETEAQVSPPPDCRDDRGVDRCAAEVQRRVLDLYGMQPIEAHGEAGDQVRRVFYVDGYGRDLLALSFTRARGHDPVVQVHWPRTQGHPRREPAQALLSEAAWGEVIARSSFFDRALVPPAGAPAPDRAPICLHSWVYTVEATDPARSGRGSAPNLRRKVEDACGEGLAHPYANWAAEAALAAIPYCAALDQDLHRNAASTLRSCNVLEGDRLSAAKAYNQALRLGETHLPRAQVAALDVFHQRAVLDWQGRRSGGERGDADEAWVAQRQAAGGTLLITRAVGESATRVRVEGVVANHRTEGGREVSVEAPVTFIFGPDPAKRELAIESAVVGSFVEARD